MSDGRFGIHGGQYIPETLMNEIINLEKQYNYYKNDPEFCQELDDLLKNYAGRPSLLYYAEKMTKDLGGAKIYLKREDLNHTGAHKINNSIGQVLLARRMGKTPARSNDFPGFIANRILLPMINEAVLSLYHGDGTKEDIDTVMKLGMNHPKGPLALADLIGLDTCLAIMNTLHQGLGDSKYRPCPLLRQYVEAGFLGRKTGRGFYTY